MGRETEYAANITRPHTKVWECRLSTADVVGSSLSARGDDCLLPRGKSSRVPSDLEDLSKVRRLESDARRGR